MVYTEKCKNNTILGETLLRFPSVRVPGRAGK